MAKPDTIGNKIAPAEWPDGTVAARYGFLHALYQEVLYERIPTGRRQRLHQRIGERQEATYDKRVREIAAELAAKVVAQPIALRRWIHDRLSPPRNRLR